MERKLSLGGAGELIAANYLLSKGWKILEKNWFNPKGYRMGELDLIAETLTGKIVFLEIKTRKGSLGKVNPGENLTPTKFKKLLKIAQNYLNQKKWQGRDWRIDLVTITLDFQRRKFSLQHTKAIHF